MMPAANHPEQMSNIQGPGPDATNRVGSFLGPMAASFQVAPTDAPGTGDLETAAAYGKRVAEVTLQVLRGRRA
jgi:NAD(P)H dehydrogenase (quinone)